MDKQKLQHTSARIAFACDISFALKTNFEYTLFQKQNVWRRRHELSNLEYDF